MNEGQNIIFENISVIELKPNAAASLFEDE
jgi:hypothetical protein